MRVCEGCVRIVQNEGRMRIGCHVTCAASLSRGCHVIAGVPCQRGVGCHMRVKYIIGCHYVVAEALAEARVVVLGYRGGWYCGVA